MLNRTCGLCLLSLILTAAPMWGQDRILLKESTDPGTAYRISTRTQLSGRITIPVGEGQPAKSVTIQGICTTAYREEILPTDISMGERRTLRSYEAFDFRKVVADVDRRMTLRPAISLMVFLEKQGKRVPFSPDGPLSWNEIEMLRTEMFLPALTDLLPGKEIKVLDTWKLSPETARDLTDLEKVDDCELIGRFVQLTTLGGRKVAEVMISGSAKGVNEDGPTKHTLKGTVYFDLEAKAVTYVSLLGEQQLFDATGKVTGNIDGRFVLTREPHATGALRSMVKRSASDLIPNDVNTRMLFENEELGISFSFPRRWHIGQSRGRQITIDEAGGSGILLTVESAVRLPTPEKYQREVGDFFRDRKLPTRTVENIRRLDRTTLPTTHFALEVSEANQRPIIDYYVVAGRSHGVTAAGRIVGVESDVLRKEVEGIVRSIQFRE